MDLSTIDLNLLVYLDALLSERHVTNAGKRLGLSQSAMSRALSRLRTLFEDDLLLKTPSGMSPTPLAERLEPQVRRMLSEISHLLRVAQPFEPSTSSGHITIALDPWALAMLEETLLFQLNAPHLSLRLEPMPQDLHTALTRGPLDIAIHFSQEMGPHNLSHVPFVHPSRGDWLHIIGSPISEALEETLLAQLGAPLGATSHVASHALARPAIPEPLSTQWGGDWTPAGFHAHLVAHISPRANYPQAVSWLLEHLEGLLRQENPGNSM